MRHLFTIMLLLSACSAQTLQLSGGGSTLMSAQGAAVTAYLPSSALQLSGGSDQGHAAIGLSDSFKYDGFNVTAGTSSFGYAVDNVGGAGLSCIGLSIAKLSQTQSLAAFIGSTGPSYNLPFFSAATAQHVGAGFFFQRRIGKFNLQSLAAFSGGQRTAVQSGAYISARLRFAGGVGLLQGKGVSNGVIGLNLVSEWHVTAMREDLFWNQLRAEINSISTSTHFDFITLSASALEGTSAARHTTGETGAITLHASFFTVTSSVYKSPQSQLLLQTASESNRHWRFNQTFQSGNGNHSFDFGGSYTSNRFMLSLDHSLMFVPFSGAAFQQVTSIALSFRIHGSHVNLGASMLPVIGTKYTASLSSFVKGPLNIQSASQSQHFASGGKFIISGCVIEHNGAPVEGATLIIGKQTAITDSNGAFFLHVQKQKALKLAVMTEQFSAPGAWHVVSAPELVTAGTQVEIIVERGAAN